MRARVRSLVLIAVAVLAGAACSNATLSRKAAAPAVSPAVTQAAPEPPPAVRVTLPKTALSEDEQIMHALNRLAYGPRPGDVERVRAMGLSRWIERQLEPGRISDERAESALKAFPTLAMPVPELVRGYPEPDPKVMAIEWAARGVRVNAIAPGYVQTEFITLLSAKGLIDPKQLARRTPMGRIGTPEEIGEVAVFLASSAASFITGEILTVDGGWSSYGYL